MSVRDDRRAEAVRRIADHLLAVGLPGSGLRSLAAAAGSSDRMLLYYFANKNEILTCVLGSLALEMGAALDRTVPEAPQRPFAALLGELRSAVQGDALRPFMRLWLDIAARAGRDEPPYREVAGVIADRFQAWIAARLQPAQDGEASLLLAAVEGMVLLDAIGRGGLADAAVAAR